MPLYAKKWMEEADEPKKEFHGCRIYCFDFGVDVWTWPRDERQRTVEHVVGLAAKGAESRMEECLEILHPIRIWGMQVWPAKGSPTTSNLPSGHPEDHMHRFSRLELGRPQWSAGKVGEKAQPEPFDLDVPLQDSARNVGSPLPRGRDHHFGSTKCQIPWYTVHTDSKNVYERSRWRGIFNGMCDLRRKTLRLHSVYRPQRPKNQNFVLQVDGFFYGKRGHIGMGL